MLLYCQAPAIKPCYRSEWILLSSYVIIYISYIITKLTHNCSAGRIWIRCPHRFVGLDRSGLWSFLYYSFLARLFWSGTLTRTLLQHPDGIIVIHSHHSSAITKPPDWPETIIEEKKIVGKKFCELHMITEQWPDKSEYLFGLSDIVDKSLHKWNTLSSIPWLFLYSSSNL